MMFLISILSFFTASWQGQPRLTCKLAIADPRSSSTAGQSTKHIHAINN